MNLRSGAVTMLFEKTKKGKKTQRANKEEDAGNRGSMAASSKQTDQSIKDLLLAFMEENTEQMTILNGHFATIAAETKEMRREMKDMHETVQETSKKLREAEQRISDLEDHENTSNEALIYLLQEMRNMNEKILKIYYIY